MGLKTKIVCLLFVPIFLLGCATAYDKRGVYHKVREGESLQRIARYYHVSVQELAEWNNIEHAGELQEGLKLYIPKAKREHVSKRTKTTKDRYDGDLVKFDRGKFIWPVDGPVMSPFGIRNGRRHDGVDIKAKRGAPIRAAGAGEVVFSGRLQGYGNMVIVKHKGKFFTVYAHNTDNKVKKGEKVAKGEVIGYVGATGRATGPHLHFEVREGQSARNPLFLLPASRPEGELVAEVRKERHKGKKESARREKMMEELKSKKVPKK